MTQLTIDGNSRSPLAMLRIGGPAVEWQDLGGTGQAPTWLRKWNELGSPVASVRHSGLGIEIAAAKWISTSCVSRFLRLALLAPNIVKAILSGWADQRVMLERLERLLPVDWEGQRQVLLRAGVRLAVRGREHGADGTSGAGAGRTGWSLGIGERRGVLREARRIRIGEVELSATIAGTGPPLLLLHGFPDAAEVWRYQVPVLAEAGYTVIAPDMRGFGRSDAPADRAAYRIDHILDDLLGLLRARDITQRVGLVGHDWGAAVGWLFCMRHADRVARFAALSVSHRAAYRSAGLRQKLKGWYILAFQLEGLAERMIAADRFRFLRRVQPTREDGERWVADLTRPGRLAAALNWYRANFRPFLSARFSAVSVPVLGVFGTEDAATFACRELATGCRSSARTGRTDFSWNGPRAQRPLARAGTAVVQGARASAAVRSTSAGGGADRSASPGMVHGPNVHSRGPGRPVGRLARASIRDRCQPEVERIDLSRVRLVVQLTLLAPDIVEAILGGWVDQRGCRLAAGWEEQCRLVRQLSVSAGGR